MKESVQDVFQDYIQSLVDGDKVSLINIQNGAAVEMFDVELQKVIRNCTDINTADGKRSITLKVEVVPNKNRTSVRFIVDCKSKIQAMEGIEDEAMKRITIDIEDKTFAWLQSKNKGASTEGYAGAYLDVVVGDRIREEQKTKEWKS